MAHAQTKQEIQLTAVIYCRVSSTKQKLDGGGLESQEQRCRAYADQNGYEVAAVFPDDASGAGDYMKRPGMVALLSFIDAQPDKNFVVIFDDLKRFARETEMHIKLRQAFKQRGAAVQCLNFKFEDSPEGKFIETIIAAQGELEREQNCRQVVQKMKARVENGFWVFRAPVGYEYVSAKGGGGKILVHQEPQASVVREALEGFASGRFATQTELRGFLEAHPHFPSDKPDGGIRPQTIVRLLNKVVYAGLVNAPVWGVSTRKGQHDGLISVKTYEKIQKRLNKGVYAPWRKDIKEDFPLRGTVACDCCSTPLTAGWTKGKTKTYPYYFCRQKGCEKYGKSIARAKIEGAFEELLETLQPSEGLIDMAKAMFRDAWDQRIAQAASMASSVSKQIKETEKKISDLVERIMDASNARVITAYEKRIEELETHKLILAEQRSGMTKQRYTFEQLFELSMKFLSSPFILWASGSFSLQRTVLKLAFVDHLSYCHENGFRTPKTTLPFKALGVISGQNEEMVPLG
ncbi:recombinase family protein [Ruegeria sp. EL01]|uniref:recombinase family protein n=1 Tax=Ruegeria sp. EL01 TaxID=2107578 RepID=UPI001C1F2CEF|nr:recombinase family protein [Ruegeria sp. EL01]